MLDILLVFVLAVLSGAWATAAGVLFGVEPMVVWIAATAGSVVYTIAVLFFAGPWRDRFVARVLPEQDEAVRGSRIGSVIDRWGVPGLAMGSIVVGPSLTLVAVLVLGIDRMSFLRWYLPITVVGFGVSTAFWVVVAG